MNTLGQTLSDNNKQLMTLTISILLSTSQLLIFKDFLKLIKGDNIIWLIALAVITLSGANCKWVR